LFDQLFVLVRKLTGERTVGVVGGFGRGPESGEGEGILFTGDGGVAAPVDRWKDIAVLIAVVVDGFYVLYSVIGETKVAEVILFVGLVDAGRGVGECYLMGRSRTRQGVD
jgi:hypothetical protein